jgi:hypothetical protein
MRGQINVYDHENDEQMLEDKEKMLKLDELALQQQDDDDEDSDETQ